MMMRPGMRMGRPGLIGTMARTAVVAGTATAVAGGVSRRQQAKAQAGQQQAAQQQAAQQQAAPQPAGPDMVEQLQELAKLKDQGILTDAEFSAQKAKILGA